MKFTKVHTKTKFVLSFAKPNLKMVPFY